MLNRRDFLKKGVLAGTGLVTSSLLSDELFAKPSTKRLTILHTNDMHSRIEPFPDDGGAFARLGGMARRATLIQQIRKEEAHVLLLDAGDIFQGTPYFNFYGGELEFKLMSEMGYDVATLGNHEFDNGIKGFAEQLPHADFSFVNSNYDFSGTALQNEIKPFKIIRKGGIKVGIFGLGIELQGLVAKANYGAIRYEDPVAVSKEMVEELRQQKCDLIICLSHIGYSYQSLKVDDLKLAAQVEGIDLIIGGHTHTFLDHPTEVVGPTGHTTSVNQVGWSGIKLGRVDFEFSASDKLKRTRTDSLAVK
jgi:5'-nucleotidase